MDQDEPMKPIQQPCDEWVELVGAASAAGRWAARELARQCTARHLARAGAVSVRVEPIDSPVSVWLLDQGHGTRADDGRAVLVNIEVVPKDLGSVKDSDRKANSVLVRHAYAAAFCTVLAEQAGVATDIVPEPVSLPAQRTADSEAGAAPKLGTTST